MRKAFTFIEMIFVIVVMGILAKFGSEIFRNVYLNYTLSVTNNKLQTDTEDAIQQISNRLQYRIKDSVIARDSSTTFDALSDMNGSKTYNLLEWVGYDIDGWLGDSTSTAPTWSGFVDVDDFTNANISTLVSPASDLSSGGRADSVIQALSPSATTIADAAIFFTGANTDTRIDYGWNTAYPYDQSDTAAHRISAAAINRIVPTAGDDFSGVDIYEQYKLSWTAYALEHNTTSGQLILYYDYQPWRGETYTNGSSAILMQKLDLEEGFKFQAVGDIIKLQICVNNDDITGEGDGGYSICKEKAIF